MTCTLLLLFACALGAHAQFQIQWKTEFRQRIVTEINGYRKSVSDACRPLRDVTYSVALENKAKALVEKCDFKLEDSGYGVVKVASTHVHEQRDQYNYIKFGIQDAWAENARYSRAQPSCKDSRTCSYFQLASQFTTQVGCYTNWCSDLAAGTTTYDNAFFSACYFTPNDGVDALFELVQTIDISGCLRERIPHSYGAWVERV